MKLKAFGLILGLALLSAGEAFSAQLTLTWTDNSTNEDGFKIERATVGGTFAQVATVAANVVIWTDAGLAESTTYLYRVRAFNSVGNSAYSNTASAKTGLDGEQPPPVKVPDGAPTQLKVNK